MKNKMYKEIYDVIGRLTPLKSDCGVLCGQRCCHGDDNTGMLLFPGEETTLRVTEKNGRRLAVCNGSCNREERPLSCRIFPFFPAYINGRIKAVPDLRGINICPMIGHADEIKFRRRFLSRVEKAGRIMFTDNECRKFITEVTNEIADIENINNLLKKKDDICK